MLKKWLLKRLTIDDLCQYFHEKGITFDFNLEKKQSPVYWAKNSIIYKRTSKG